VEGAGTTYRAGGGSIVTPTPISLQERGGFAVLLEDVSEVRERRQPHQENVLAQKSRAINQFMIALRSRSTPAISANVIGSLTDQTCGSEPRARGFDSHRADAVTIGSASGCAPVF
jgi:hypothetical protein